LSIKKKELRQIIVVGGGGFSDEPDNPLLDLYIIAQSKKQKPKICFLPTAGADPDDYIQRFYKAYEKFPCVPSHLALTRDKMTLKMIESFILTQDIIFAGGGNPNFLMKVWRETGMDKILKKAWKKGIILSGMSAGAMCWFQDAFTNLRNDTEYRKVNAMGLLKGSFCPHYHRPELIEVYDKMISKGLVSNGFGVEDGTALHFMGTKLYKVVSSRSGSKAYKIRKRFGKIISETLNPGFLGKKEVIHH
jgi:peptidase E